MSKSTERSLHGDVTVVARTPSFAERYHDRFGLPEQEKMHHMMRATAAGLPWDATEEMLVAAEKQTPSSPFETLTLGEYAQLSNNVKGAPMPDSIKDHISDVKSEFPGVDVRVHAHPNDDPFVEFELGGEKLFGIAWLRVNTTLKQVYPVRGA